MFYILFLIIGAIAGWLIAKFKFKSERGISKDELEAKYISKELYNKIESDFLKLQQEAKAKDNEILELNKKLSSSEQIIENLNEKLENSKKEIESLQEKFQLEFENVANKLLENTSEKFLKLNKDNIDTILKPLKDKIEEFKQKVEDTYTKEVKDITSLKTEIEQLVKLSQQVSDDANKLASALKGDSKIMGDWGEVKLEVILEHSGLVKNIHYRKQETFLNEEDKKRPDYIINLPENRNLIIDSKVSLVAYEKYFNTENLDEKEEYLNNHLESMKSHIKELSLKNYQNLYQISAPDYVLMFIPIEAAYFLAIKEDPSIFKYAWDKNIILVTTSTLLATLRTISYIWRQEKQKKNVLEIARQSGALYDKFVDFVNDLITIGKKIDDAKESFNSAMNKLCDSKKKGDSLIERAEKIKELGARTTKMLPKEVIDRLEYEQNSKEESGN